MTDTNWTAPRPARPIPLLLTIAAMITLLPAAVAAAPGVAGTLFPTPGVLTVPTVPVDTPLYRLLPDGVFERSGDGGARWQAVEGLPTRVLPAHLAGTPLPVTAFAIDPGDRRRLLVAVGARLFLSVTSGATWTEIDVGGTINGSTYVTAATFDPMAPDRWILGTSYDGLYLTEDGGGSWTDITADWTIGLLYLGAGFYEEIAGLEIEPDGTVIVELGMGGGFVSLDLAAQSATRLRPLVDGARAFRAPARATVLTDGAAGRDETAEQTAAARRTLAADRTGIYLAAPNASTDRLPEYLDYIERHGFNSIVVDLKDDYGRVTYDTALDPPRRVGAVEPFVDLPTLVRMAHERDVYVIARIVVFKDRRFYRYDGNRFALWDSARDQPWGVFRTVTDEETAEQRVVQVEHWVDPYAPEVWDYNISIAEEVVSLGVDEIQFDYIRFPSDGNTRTIASRFAPDGADRVQALEAFLAAARERLEVPIGIDVFGFNAWSHMSYLGQDIARLGEYVDVISPMFYPSHFALSFLPELSYLDRSRVIYDDGTRRAREITARSASGSVLIRPYVQAFLIGPELQYEAPDYLRYLQLQLEGAANAVADGYTLWNASGRYYMLP